MNSVNSVKTPSAAVIDLHHIAGQPSLPHGKYPMVTGQKVVCVNDAVEPEIRRLYDKWITKGTTYVIRDVMLAQNRQGEWGEIGLLLQGIVNPAQTIPPFQERSFNSERFRPIEDRSLTESLEQEQYAEIEN